MAKFAHNIRVGDTVRVLDNDRNQRSATWRGRIGSTMQVTSVTQLGSLRLDHKVGSWGSDRFEKVAREGADEVKVGTYVVILVKEGVLHPAVQPKVYSTDVQANKIAKLMAEKHGGTFQVFKATGEYIPPQAEATYRAL